MGVTLVSAMGGERLWDDAYREVIRALSSDATQQVKDGAEVIQGSMWGWAHSSDYNRVREVVGGLESPIDASVRLEIGSQANGEYSFVWLVREAGRTVVYSNLNGRIRVAELADEEWQRISGILEDLKAWNMATTGDFAVFDGTAYFVSILLSEGSGQFVVYAPVLDDRQLGSARRQFATRTSGQTTVIRLLLECGREAEPAQRN